MGGLIKDWDKGRNNKYDCYKGGGSQQKEGQIQTSEGVKFVDKGEGGGSL